jgi:hypothetical protein
MQVKGLNKLLNTFLFISSITLIGCEREVEINPSSCLPYPIPSDLWIYPVIPGTLEWEAIPTVEKRFEACQIPEELLENMTTEALIQSWVDFPFKFNIFGSSNFHSGMQFLIQNFNGLKELSGRIDSGKKLLDRYMHMNPDCVKYEVGKEGEFTLTYPIIELLLSQDKILEKLTLNQKKILVSEALEKYHGKKKNSEYFGTASFNLIICMKAMVSGDYQPFIRDLEGSTSTPLFIFYETGKLLVADAGTPEVSMILNHSKNFIR